MLGKLSVPGRPTRLDDSRARAYCTCSRCGWGLFGHFSLIYLFSFLSPSLWETARYRLKYCLKGPLSPKQPTNLFIFLPPSGRYSHCHPPSQKMVKIQVTGGYKIQRKEVLLVKIQCKGQTFSWDSLIHCLALVYFYYFTGGATNSPIFMDKFAISKTAVFLLCFNSCRRQKNYIN